MSKIAKFESDTSLAGKDIGPIRKVAIIYRRLYVGEHKLAKFRHFEELYLHYFSTNHFQTWRFYWF